MATSLLGLVSSCLLTRSEVQEGAAACPEKFEALVWDEALLQCRVVRTGSCSKAGGEAELTAAGTSSMPLTECLSRRYGHAPTGWNQLQLRQISQDMQLHSGVKPAGNEHCLQLASGLLTLSECLTPFGLASAQPQQLFLLKEKSIIGNAHRSVTPGPWGIRWSGRLTWLHAEEQENGVQWHPARSHEAMATTQVFLLTDTYQDRKHQIPADGADPYPATAFLGIQSAGQVFCLHSRQSTGNTGIEELRLLPIDGRLLTAAADGTGSTELPNHLLNLRQECLRFQLWEF